MRNKYLEMVYQKYYKQLFLFAFSLCHNKEDAEDLVANTFVKAMLSYNEGNLKAWLYTVLKNEFYNLYRKRKKTITEELIDFNEIKDSLNVLEEYIKEDKKRWLYNQIYLLRDKEKQIMLLAIQEDLDDKTIANIVGLTIENVRIIKYRVRKKLKDLCMEEGYL